MKPKTVWILVADGARARIVEYNGPQAGLSPAMDHEFAASHAASRDFVADKPGRGQGGVVGAGHAVAPKVDWHTFEKHLFAKEMVQVLEDAHGRNAFDELVLIAPPTTLGDLRKALSPQLSARVRGEVGKDLTHVAIHDLGAHLGDVLVI